MNFSRNKLMYGPTWGGLEYVCDLNPKIQNEMDIILDAWFNQPKFIEYLKKDFGDIVTENPDYAKTLVKKMIKYFSRIDKEVEKMTYDEFDKISWLAGEQMLIAKHPAEIKTVIEFYKHVKFYRDNINRTIAMNRNIQQFFESITKA